MALNCDVNTRLAAAGCFSGQCLGDSEREAIQLYARVANLAASGGTDFSTDLTALQEAAKEWQSLSQAELAAIDVQISVANAVANGASIETGANALKEASACYACLGAETRHQISEFLRCALSNLNASD